MAIVLIEANWLPLPIGAATSAKQPSLGTPGEASDDVITVQGSRNNTPLATSAKDTDELLFLILLELEKISERLL